MKVEFIVDSHITNGDISNCVSEEANFVKTVPLNIYWVMKA